MDSTIYVSIPFLLSEAPVSFVVLFKLLCIAGF